MLEEMRHIIKASLNVTLRYLRLLQEIKKQCFYTNSYKHTHIHMIFDTAFNSEQLESVSCLTTISWPKDSIYIRHISGIEHFTHKNSKL